MQRKCLLESGLIMIFLKESREGVCETFLKEQVQFEDENPEKNGISGFNSERHFC